jgi:hypothetical protein
MVVQDFLKKRGCKTMGEERPAMGTNAVLSRRTEGYLLTFFNSLPLQTTIGQTNDAF